MDRITVHLGNCKQRSTPKYIPLLGMRYGPGGVTGAPTMMDLVFEAKKFELYFEGTRAKDCNERILSME